MRTRTVRTAGRGARAVRGAAAVAAVAVLGLTAACGGSPSGGGSGGEKAGRDGASSPSSDTAPESSPGASKAPARGGSAGKALSEQELEKAVLAGGDVPGFAVSPMGEAPPGGEKAEKAACRPLTAVINGRPEPAASAAVYRQVVGKGSAAKQVVTEFLTAHGPGGAEQVLDDLRAAIDACAGGFTSRTAEGPSTYSGVKELSAPKAGDDALAYQVTGDYEGEAVPLVFQVVRSGGTVATFYTANLVDAETPEIPAAVVTAQADKLGRAAGER